MTRPTPRDADAVVSFVRRGTVVYELADLPGEFAQWRRTLRQSARRHDIRISVRRTHDSVPVHHPDRVVTDDERRALADVMASELFGSVQPGAGHGACPLTYDEALARRRRQRMQLLPGGADPAKAPQQEQGPRAR